MCTGQGVIIQQPSAGFGDKASCNGIHCSKKHDDPEKCIPGRGIDHTLEGEVADEDGGDHVQKKSIEGVLRLPLEGNLFKNEVFDLCHGAKLYPKSEANFKFKILNLHNLLLTELNVTVLRISKQCLPFQI